MYNPFGQSRKAYDEGYNARISNYPAKNPYTTSGINQIAWSRGFEDGVTADFHQFVALDVEFDDRGDAQLVVFDNVENPVIRTRQSSWLDRELLPRHGATVVIPPESKEAKYQQLLLELQ